jgi:conjugation system TraG family ATPase
MPYEKCSKDHHTGKQISFAGSREQLHLSKDADITACFEVRLPELFTVASAEYEAIHSAWHKAIKTLPDFTVIHKQDWYIKESYAPDLARKTRVFIKVLSTPFQRATVPEPLLLPVPDKDTKERMRMQSNFSSLCKGTLIPKEIRNKETIHRFMEAVAQFERIVNDSGFVSLQRLTEDDIIGTEKTGITGTVPHAFEGSRNTNAGHRTRNEEVRIGNKRLSLHTLSDTDDLPGTVSADTRFEKLSTDRSDCRLSFAAPVGLLLAATTSTTSICFWITAKTTCKSLRSLQGICTHWQGTAVPTKSTKSG